MKVASIWSGGKDSCLACLKAIQKGHKVKYLLNLISKKDDHVSFSRNLNKDLIRLQSEATGIPLLQIKIASQMDKPESFNRRLRSLSLNLIGRGIEGLVFGYFLPYDYQRVLAKRLSRETGLKIIEPLCNRDPKGVVKELVSSGFKMLITDIDCTILDSSWVGSYIDKDFMKYLETKPDVDFSGDRGEYSSFVIDAPLFKKRIEIQKVSRINRDNHLFLDIQKYRLLGK